MWAEHSREQISGDLTSGAQISCNVTTAALLQSGTRILTLHRHFCERVIWAGLAFFRWAWAVTEQNDREKYRLFANTWFWWRAKCSWRAGSYFSSIGISSRNSRCLYFALFMNSQIDQTEKTQGLSLCNENCVIHKGKTEEIDWKNSAHGDGHCTALYWAFRLQYFSAMIYNNSLSCSVLSIICCCLITVLYINKNIYLNFIVYTYM